KDSAPRIILTDDNGAQKLRPQEVLDELEGVTVITLQDLQGSNDLPAFDNPPYSAISSDIACLIYTSGSTGSPKAVISPHRNMLFSIQAIQQELQISTTDVIGNFLPFSFDYGMYQIFLSFYAGATMTIGDN